MSAAPRAERLRDHFVGWQCRIRADAMRRREGRPTFGMRPQALSAAGEELAPAVTTLLVRKEAEAFAPELRNLARRTHDPRVLAAVPRCAYLVLFELVLENRTGC